MSLFLAFAIRQIDMKINNKHMQIILPPTDFPRTVLYVKFRIFDENQQNMKINLNMNWMKYLDQPLLKDN